jgi:hypothetical protein
VEIEAVTAVVLDSVVEASEEGIAVDLEVEGEVVATSTGRETSSTETSKMND